MSDLTRTAPNNKFLWAESPNSSSTEGLHSHSNLHYKRDAKRKPVRLRKLLSRGKIEVPHIAASSLQTNP